MNTTETLPAEEDIVFVCGALRSGTTLLRLMINDHPALSNPGEMDFLFEPPIAADGAPDLDAYAHELSFNRVFEKCALKIDLSLGYEDLVRDFVRQLRTSGRLLTINAHRHFDRIPKIFPNARYVHLLRDPRDVAKSSIGMGWAGNVYHGVDHWIASEKAFDRLSGLVAPKAVHTMRNEDLIRSPETTLADLCRFLGVDYDPKMLEYPNHTTYSRPDPRLVEQWRTEIAPADLALLEGKLGPMMVAKGYAPSGTPPRLPRRFERFLLGQENRLGRWWFSVTRNGPILTALDLIARRLPSRGFREFTRRRIAARQLRFLK